MQQPFDLTSTPVTLSLSASDWIKIVLVLAGQLIVVGGIVWKAAFDLASRMISVETKVDEVIKNHLQEHDRRLGRIEDKIFPTGPATP